MNKRIWSVCVFTLSMTSALAFAQAGEDAAPAEGTLEEAAAGSGEPFFDVFNNERLTGDWGGVRTSLEDQGIEIGLSMTHIYQHNVHGGMQTHRGHRFTGSADYEVVFDTEALGWWDGGVFYLAGESAWNDGIGEDRVGNLFGVNGDAGGDEEFIIRELWYEQMLWEGKARFRIGKMDIGVDVDTNAYANDETSQFLNPALINTGNLAAPDLGIGAQLIVQPLDWMYFGIVAADAQADRRETGLNTTFHDEDYFFAGFELGFLPVWDTPWGKLPGGYRFGVWYDPQPKEMFFNDLGGRRLTIPTKRDDVGFFFNMDQMVWKELPEDNADSQGLGMFFRYGFAHEEANAIEHFWSVGAQYQGLFPTRDEDVLGFGFAQGVLSGMLRDLGGVDHESVYELYYTAQVLPWLNVSPDFQYIVNPGAVDGRDSFVAGVRLQMSF
ncbi:MAG: carbohydrate porin [Phycisphaerales bacterium]|nr:MAG: carbohydrate porin [Phycisphaerales bacterium]